MSNRSATRLRRPSDRLRIFRLLVGVAAASGCRGESTPTGPGDGGTALARGSAAAPSVRAAGVGGSNVGSGPSGGAGLAGISTAGAGPRLGTDGKTIVEANDEEIVALEDATGYVVRRKELALEEAGSCCCYGSGNKSLDAKKQKARVTISDARTAEVLVQKVFDPPKTCPKLQDLEGIEPAFTRSVPSSVIVAWAKKSVLEIERRKQRPASVPKN